MPEVVAQGLDDTLRAALVAAATPPQERLPEPLPRWTLKRLVQWVKDTFAIDCSRETLRRTLKRLGFSWKKARKLLNQANPQKRAVFLTTLQGWLDEALHEQCLLVYIDEAMFIAIPMKAMVGRFAANVSGCLRVHQA
ncbi:MAG: winged helix-turn-helix domain-containing protein [Cyanobacteria bacterium J06639_14]